MIVLGFILITFECDKSLFNEFERTPSTFEKWYDLGGEDFPTGVVQLSDSSFVIAASVYAGQSGFLTKLLKIGSFGEIIKIQPIERFTIKGGMIKMPNDDIIILGNHRNEGPLLMRFDSSLNLLDKLILDSDHPNVYDVTSSNFGDFIITGHYVYQQDPIKKATFIAITENFDLSYIDEVVDDVSCMETLITLSSDRSVTFNAYSFSDAAYCIINISMNPITKYNWRNCSFVNIIIHALVEARNGNIVSLGYSQNLDSPGITLHELDLEGNIVKTKVYRLSFRDGYLLDITPSHDGGFIAVGGSSANADGDLVISEIKENFDLGWIKRYGGVLNEVGRAVIPTFDGGYLIISTSNSFGNGDEDIYVVKTDKHGVIDD